MEIVIKKLLLEKQKHMIDNNNHDPTYDFDVDRKIVHWICCFMDGSTLKKGRDKQTVTELKNVIFQACTSFAAEEKRQAIANKNRFGKSYIQRKEIHAASIPEYEQTVAKRELMLVSLQRRSIVEFCHSDEESYVDSNFDKVVRVTRDDGSIAEHAPNVFAANTMKDMYNLFPNSEVVER